MVYKGHYFYGQYPVHEGVTNIYSKKGLAVNNCPKGWDYKDGIHISHVVEYEIVPTGRKFNMKGELIE